MNLARRALVLALVAPPSLSFLQRGASRPLSIVAANMASEKDYYRADGVRIAHDPYAPGMAEQYGLPGSTDSDGFDPYADTVGPGIYGGSVKRDPKTGEVEIGRQYQDHNSRPGPVYDGKGYSLMSRAIQVGPEKVEEILRDFPVLVNEISTGGSTPLHTAGMSKRGQLSAQVLIDHGADINAIDTYGYNALHRMASNNLDIGGEALIKAGLDPYKKTGEPYAGDSPVGIAKSSRAIQFLMMLQRNGLYD
mmetsp:Transcript_17396/g.49801  ORF Transcript_17396/g.49801 Transcript_17396/m.49801 type:complete len:250 (+) Transcript_17396:97-846(+)